MSDDTIKADDAVEILIDTATINKGSRLYVTRVDGPIAFCRSPRGNEVWFERNEVKKWIRENG